MRQKIVAGNWKMNNDLHEGLKLASEVFNLVNEEISSDVMVLLAPPAIHLYGLKNLTNSNEKVQLAAQNCSEHPYGAYTGEISAAMVKSCGAKYVILGHSERRQLFGESNETLARKVDLAIANDLRPIFCCGESSGVRDKGEHTAYVSNQIEESLFHLDENDFSKVVIAYEPIWAIGTGVNATAEQAQEMHKAIRDFVQQKYGKEIAENLSILYGGSCKSSNAPELFECPDVDGGLIGGASLQSIEFVNIVKSFPS